MSLYTDYCDIHIHISIMLNKHCNNRWFSTERQDSTDIEVIINKSRSTILSLEQKKEAPTKTLLFLDVQL